ncbi:MAG TPA: hypothetical protein PLD25_24340 [Chloroflexota bacterium]|nr:hypothetical protein [Chloroflexota bacterium]
MRRIWTLTNYFTASLFRSLTGVGLIIATLVFWLIFFNPRQQTPEMAYYVLVIGVFGAGMGFLITIMLAARANHANLYSWVVRLPSRVEYMTAVFLSAVITTLILQLLLAVLALVNGPQLQLQQLIEIPPVWLSLLILAVVLALHAADLVARGWSRVYLFGLLAILLFAQSIHNSTIRSVIMQLNRVALSQGWTGVNDRLANYAITLNGNEVSVVGQLFGLVFWPFRALAEATVNGYFTTTQALAPAILLLYATILFMLAADLFANKDLAFVE